MEICLGADTTVDADIGVSGTPMVNIWSRHSDVEIQPHGSGTAGPAAAEELVWATSWYARQVRTLVQRDQRQVAEHGDPAWTTGQPGGLGGVGTAEQLARAWGWLLDAATVGAPVPEQVGLAEQVGQAAAGLAVGGLEEPLRYPCGCPMLAGMPWPGSGPVGRDVSRRRNQRRLR